MSALAASPPFILTYGQTKLGKSANDLWTAGASGAFIVYHEDGVSGARDVLGMQLRPDQIRPAYRLETATAIAAQIGQENVAYREKYNVPLYLFLCVDDLSMLVENELGEMRKMTRYQVRNNKGGIDYTFTIWTDLMDKLIGFGNVARYAGLTVLANAHVRDPSTDKNGVYHRGGPFLPSAKMVSKLPHVATSIWKVEQMPEIPLWPVGIRCEPDPNWIMGDRRGLVGTAPLNTAERLRSLGYDVPRPAGLEWIEDWANTIALRLDEGHEQAALLQKAKGMLVSQDRAPQHVYWAIRDGLHRHIFRKIAANSLLDRI